MKRFVYLCVVCASIVASPAAGQTVVLPADGTNQAEPIRPRSPGGVLGDTLGSYFAIEGVLYHGNGKVESNTLLVDTVDGKKLKKPVFVLVRNVLLPANERCILKGYELGEMIGRAPAEYAAAREQGKDPDELARRDQTIWRWRPYFVVLIAAKPEGLELRNP